MSMCVFAYAGQAEIVSKMPIQKRIHTGLDPPATAWTELPECVYEVVMQHFQDDREVSAIFRRVCHAWRETHDRLVTVVKVKSAPQDVRIWRIFGAVKSLHLNASLVCDSDVRALSPLTTLTDLNISSCKAVSDEGLKELALLTGLTSLDLGGCCKLRNEGVLALSQLTALTNLRLAGCEAVRNEGLMALAQLTGLTSLSLTRCDWVNGEVLRALAPLTALSSLHLVTCGVSNKGVRALAQLTALTNLNLAGCEGVLNEGVRALAPLTALTSLNLDDGRGGGRPSPAHRPHQP